jgi:hypothetical protein
MDPLSALSVAAAVVQFVDYGTKIVSKGRELYKSADGALSENIKLDTTATRLPSLSSTFEDSLRRNQFGLSQGPLYKNDHALQEICKECIELSNQLAVRLEKLEVPDGHPHKKWKSF